MEAWNNIEIKTGKAFFVPLKKYVGQSPPPSQTFLTTPPPSGYLKKKAEKATTVKLSVYCGFRQVSSPFYESRLAVYVWSGVQLSDQEPISLVIKRKQT